jgi:hypothetical protein
MSGDFNPQEFGRLQAEVIGLRRDINSYPG